MVQVDCPSCCKNFQVDPHPHCGLGGFEQHSGARIASSTSDGNHFQTASSQTDLAPSKKPALGARIQAVGKVEGEHPMARGTKFKPEEIIAKLREAEDGVGALFG